MKSWIKPAICLMCLAGSIECLSQEGSIAIAEIAPVAGGLEATAVNPRTNIPEEDLPVDPSVSTGSGGVLSVPAITARAIDKKYLLLNGLQTGMSVFDVEMTQRCIAARRCRELNPVMPSSQAGQQLSVNFAVAAFEGWSSYWLKKHHSSAWWVPLIAGTVVHSVGVATGFEHY